jgi:hypothetical protein
VPLAEGREAQVFLRADGRVVKVMRSVRQEPQVLREAAALQALADRQHLAPAFREVTEVAGRPALVSDAQGDPAADVARTLLLLRMGELPPNMSQSMRALTPIGRGILARRYLAIYRRSTARDLSRLDDWLFVRAAARFNERIDVEYPRLLRLL